MSDREPRPENPVPVSPEPERNPHEGWTPTSDGPTIIYAHPEDYVWGDLVNEGHRQNWTRLVPAAAFDAVVAERDEMIRVSAANIAATQRNMDALRAHTLGAHDRPLCCGCDDDIETLAAMANAGDRLAKVVARVCGEGHPALAAWRSVSGSSEPR